MKPLAIKYIKLKKKKEEVENNWDKNHSEGYEKKKKNIPVLS